MDAPKNKLYLYSIIFSLIVINLTLIMKIDVEYLKGKRFTYEDGVILYNICVKKWGNKETLIDRVYEDKKTDFRDFILWK